MKKKIRLVSVLMALVILAAIGLTAGSAADEGNSTVTADPEPIESVTLTVTKPSDGKISTNFMPIKDFVVPASGAKYKVQTGSWYNLDGTRAEPSELESFTFEAGKTYKLWVCLEADYPYFFNDSTEVTVTNGTVFKTEAYVNDSFTYSALNVDMSITIDEYCKVSFDANGGTGTMDTFEVLKGDMFWLPACDFTPPSGKEFDQWDKGKPTEEIKITADTVIKAMWKDKAANPTAEPDPTAEPSGDKEEVTLKKLKSVKLKAVSKKKITVSWKKLSSKDRKKIKKIQIQVSTDPEFKTILKEKYVSSKKTSYTIPGLTKNTKYYVRVRAYTEKDGVKHVSEWVMKNKKTKKK